MTKTRTCSALAGLFCAGLAYGHHGIANVDLNRDSELEGVVTGALRPRTAR